VETASVDVTEDGAVEEFARVVVERFGRIDLWVNNAGVLDPIGPLVDVGPRALREHFDVNVMGVAAGSVAFARHVRSRPGTGVLVNMSSGAATKPYEGWGPYCGSKAAVEIMTEVIAREERAHGLRAYALAPGVVDTDMQALIRSTPPDRFPQVDRFLRLHADRSFTTPAWVGAYILDRLAADVGPDAPDPGSDPSAVRLRVPDEP
jgi:NAD(P)-dependent dehydrogenase (short-subunit alcohol dehydrogenase family)